jgi:hypothetical protein
MKLQYAPDLQQQQGIKQERSVFDNVCGSSASIR